MKKIIIKNALSDISINDVGITLIDGHNYEVPPQDWPLWAASIDTVSNLINGNISLSDGEDILPLRYAIGVLQDNQAVINEYYTLVQEEGVLIGNGEILYYNDAMWSTENVPFDTNEQLEDDDF